MLSARTSPEPLSDSDIRQISANITDGRPPIVWFTAHAVGMREGYSGKVIGVDDRVDPDFLRVRPTGSKDTLCFSPEELTLTKPARGKRRGTVGLKAQNTLW